MFSNPANRNNSQLGNFSQGNIFNNTSIGQDTNMFGNFNPNNPNVFTNQNSSMFQNSSVPQNNIEGAMGQSNPMFGQNNNSGNQGGNFLQNFALKSASPPVGVNPSLLAPRK